MKIESDCKSVCNFNEDQDVLLCDEDVSTVELYDTNYWCDWCEKIKSKLEFVKESLTQERKPLDKGSLIGLAAILENVKDDIHDIHGLFVEAS